MYVCVGIYACIHTVAYLYTGIYTTLSCLHTLLVNNANSRSEFVCLNEIRINVLPMTTLVYPPL
jgi:hypothetical protein